MHNHKVVPVTGDSGCVSTPCLVTQHEARDFSHEWFTRRHLAIDLGASGGRLMEGTFDGSKLELTERHRFLNQPVMLPDGFHWDILRIFHEIR